MDIWKEERIGNQRVVVLSWSGFYSGGQNRRMAAVDGGFWEVQGSVQEHVECSWVFWVLLNLESEGMRGCIFSERKKSKKGGWNRFFGL